MNDRKLLKYIMKFTAVALVFVFATCFVSCGKKSESRYGAVKKGDVVISEVVSSNAGSYTTADGLEPDWIEIRNVSDRTLDMVGCGLSDSAKKLYRFTFANLVLNPGEYAVIPCAKDLPEGELNAQFGISSEGETVYLSSPGMGIISKVEVPAMEKSESYILQSDGTYTVSKRPTPMADNKIEAETTIDAKLFINEYMMENDCCAKDADGETNSWVEIKNGGNETVDMAGFYLSDSTDNTKKWQFPQVELNPNGIMLVQLSGKDGNGTEVHASFKLSEDDDALIISDESGYPVDIVEYPQVNNGMFSIGRVNGKDSEWKYFCEPTPGKENSTKYVDSIELAEKYLPDLYISEVKSAGDEYDWIEIANKGSDVVSLSGFGLSDKSEELYRYTFAETSIEPGEFKVVSLKDKNQEPYADFGIKRATETVYLTNAEGTVIDKMNTGVQSDSISCGRNGSSNERVFFTEPTKGSANSSDVLKGYASAPVFSLIGGYANSGTTLEISAGNGETVYYTTDGSKPTDRSNKYNGAITINETSCIRAISYAPGKLASPVITENYLVGVTHEVPVVFVDMDPDDFNGEKNGIYAKGAGYYTDEANNMGFIHQHANYWQDWEREMNFTFYEKDGTKGVSFDAGIKVFGQYSREEAQKSFSVHLRGEYGQKNVTYPFFRDCDITTFKSFILRTSGQDWKKTKIIDALTAQTVKGYTNVDIMEYRPCVLYINGEYWGLYNIREKENENYVESHYGNDGAEKGNIDMIKGDRNQQAGDRTEWMDLRKYVVQYLPWYGQPNKTNSSEFMNHIEERIDIDSLIDWLCIEAYFGNTDTGNLRQMRYNGGKWRWMLFDMDWSLQAGSEYSPNYLAELFNNDGHGSGNLFWAHLHMMIFYNDTWREKFITRYAYLLNNVFDTDRVCTLIDAMAAEIRPEMARNVERWGMPDSVSAWEEKIEALKGSAGKRRSQAVKELKKVFELSDSRIEKLFPNG